jgi:hypothetical protein
MAAFVPAVDEGAASIRSRTEAKLPRRMAWRVMIEKKIRR